MRLLLFIVCLISNMCLFYCKGINIPVSLNDKGECEMLKSYRFKIGEPVKLNIYKQKNLVLVQTLEIKLPSASNNPQKGNNVSSVNIPYCTNDGGNWSITLNHNGKWYSCNTDVNIYTEENMIEACVPLVTSTLILFIIIIAQTCGLVYLTFKVKRLQEPGREKCIEDRPETPLSDDRYIKDPVLRNKKIIDNNRDSEIYDIPDITIGDQNTLKSNVSIAQRPPMPIPDEDVYLEPGEVLNDLPPAFDTSGRPRPNKKPEVSQEKQMKPLPVPMEPTKPKITPAMLNKFQNNQLQSSLGRSRDPLPDPPGPVRNMEPKVTPLRIRDPPTESPIPARKFELKSTLGRSRDPLPDPPGQARNIEPKPTTLGRRGPLPEPPGPARNIEVQSTLGRSRDPLPEPPGPVRNIESTFPKNRGVQMPPAQYPIPGPSNLKKPLKPTTQPPIMPVPGPDALKRALKPVPPPNRPKPQPPKEHHAPFSNRLLPPPSIEVPMPNRPTPSPSVEVPVQRSPASLDEQVKIFNEQRELEQFPSPLDDDEWETYEPLDQINIYNV